MSLPRLALGALLLHGAASAPRAAVFGRSESGSQRGPAIELRKRVHVNTLITAPDTMDLQFGGAFSRNGSFTFPTLVGYTPEGSHIYWGRTEFSAGFDSVNSSVQFFNRTTQLGDRATFAATCVIHDGDKLDIAFAPSASFLFRGDTGARLGATAIARYDAGRSSAGITFTWTGATASSDTNPAGIFDVGAGYGFRLKPSGPLGHLTPHMNAVYEKATRVNRQISLFEGVEYQVTGPLAIDFSAQHLSLWGGETEHQFVVGLTINTSRLHHH